MPQLYRLLDTAFLSKGFVQMVSLLNVLDCDVQIVVKRRTGSGRGKASGD